MSLKPSLGAVCHVLGDPSYRRHAEELRAEIEALPGPEQAVTFLERLARGMTGLTASTSSGGRPDESKTRRLAASSELASGSGGRDLERDPQKIGAWPGKFCK